MQIVVEADGSTRAVYDEAINLAALGTLMISRASHVEPDDLGRWWVDLAPVMGPRFGPFERRRDALLAEHGWLEAHWLLPQG